MLKDYPGFIINRVLMPMINEAFYTLMEGIASAEDIDSGMKLGTKPTYGTFNISRFYWSRYLLCHYESITRWLRDSKYRPCPLLKKYMSTQGILAKNGARCLQILIFNSFLLKFMHSSFRLKFYLNLKAI